MRKLILFTLTITCITLLFGCKAKEKIIQVPVIQKEYVYKDSIRYDSVYCHDSIYIKETDSIKYVDRIKYLYKYKNIIKTDSFIVKDTVMMPVEKIVEKEVEKPLTGSQKFFMGVGKTTTTALIIFLLGVLIMAYIKHKQ